MKSVEYYIQKAQNTYPKTIFYRVGVWTFSMGYGYFTGVEISTTSVNFIMNQPLGFGTPQEAVAISDDKYQYILSRLRGIFSNFIYWVEVLPEDNSKNGGLVSVATYDWCLCNNAKEIKTQEYEDGVRYNDKNWVGSMDGLNVRNHANSVLDTYLEIIKSGKVKYISHTIFELLDKALSFEYEHLFNYVASDYNNRLKQ